MITLRTQIEVANITGKEITEFLLDCTDDDYQRWWPGTHLSLHTIQRLSGDIGNVVFMDEFIGQKRVKAKVIVKDVIPGQRLVWQIVTPIPLPVWFTLELDDEQGQVRLTHIITAGFKGIGIIFDPLFRLYFSGRFAKAMDEHVRTEFPKLRDMLRS